MPLNRSPTKGFITASPPGPAMSPMSSEPSRITCAPSVSDSCSSPPMDGEEVAGAAPGASRRARLASSTARMMAGDSISAIAAAMCPP